jgi:hypothetical protein
METIENAGSRGFGFLSSPVFKSLHFPEPIHRSCPIGEVLVDLGFADQLQVSTALERAQLLDLPPETVLLQDGVVTGRQLAQALASSNGLPFLDYDEFPVDDRVLEGVDTHVAREHMAIPCAMLNDDTILIAVSDPASVRVMKNLGVVSGQHVVCALAQENDIYFMIRRAEQLQDLAA